MNKPFLKRFPRFFFSSLWALGIFGLFVFDFSETTKDLPLIPYADKIVHALLFLFRQAFCCGNSIFEILPLPPFPSAVYLFGRYRFLFIRCFDRAYSTFSTLPGAELMDLLFDLMGSLAAFSCLVLILIWRENKR